MIKKNNRLAELDALRGIAAICVVVFILRANSERTTAIILQQGLIGISDIMELNYFLLSVVLLFS